jgi:hypothetical protein
MPLLIQICAWWFHTSSPGSSYRENPDGYLLAHLERRDGNLLVETLIQTLRMLGPRGGVLGSTICWLPLCCFIPRYVCSEQR